MRIDTRWDIGDTVWFLEGYKAQSAKISGVNIQKLGAAKAHVAYKFIDATPKMESQVFKTKEELIKYISR